MPLSRSTTPLNDQNVSFNDSHSTILQNQVDDARVESNPIIPRPRKFILTKYTIYVTTLRMYIVGSNTRETVFRILEIDLTSTEKLIVMEDNVYFTRNEIMEVLNGIEDSSEGGLVKKLTAVGLLGFIRFTKCYYLLVVKKRREVAVLGSHEIYHIEDTQLISVTNNPKEVEKSPLETRYIQTFQNIDLNKTFYFSYSYDLTNNLQTNMLRNKRQSLHMNGDTELSYVFDFNERFIWNGALLEPIFQTFDKVYDWFQPIIHGFVDQVKNSVFQIQFYITLIARRSHRYAGARFFKRGVNDEGDVANEVETEQIVADMLTSSFHDPAAGFYNNPRYTSFVQHRGSIPLQWSQETVPNLRMTKPPIELSVIDPYFSRAALHFNNLFERYGTPIQILNLIKEREKTPRETKLLDAFNQCVDYLNQFLPENKKLDYTAWDMSRAAKSRSQDVIKWLENYSERSLNTTGFFHNGRTIHDTQLQQGICRTNCVDCLDRTNTAQFVIGKRALGHQLHALGIIEENYLEYDSDVTNVLTEMFHDHGDTIALQYGGSHLVNTLQTYRKINQWSSHSRDMIESIKRFYSNSFVDAQRQDAINLFLGNYVYSPEQPMLWEMNTDYYLHNRRITSELNGTNSYTHWFNDNFLVDRKQHENEEWERNVPDRTILELQKRGLLVIKVDPYPGCFENYWNIKYGSRNYVSLNELFEFTMNSTRQYSYPNDQKHNYYKQALGENENKKEKTSIGSSNPTRLGIISLFKGRNNCNNGKTSSELPRRSKFGSFSERLRGTSPRLIFDPEYEDDNYFSPFKSRKPHRELRILYATQGQEDAVAGDSLSEDEEDLLLEKYASLRKVYIENDQEKQLMFEECTLLLHSLELLSKTEKYYEIIKKSFDDHYRGMQDKGEEGFISFPVIKSTINEETFSGMLLEKLENNEKERKLDNIPVFKQETNVDESLSVFERDLPDLSKLSGLFRNHCVDLPKVSNENIELYNQSLGINSKIPVVGLEKLASTTMDEDSLPKSKENDVKKNYYRQLIQEYKYLENPFLNMSDSKKYRHQVKLLKETHQSKHARDVSFFNASHYEQNALALNHANDSTPNLGSNSLSAISDAHDFYHYTSFSRIGNNPLKENVGGLQN